MFSVSYCKSYFSFCSLHCLKLNFNTVKNAKEKSVVEIAVIRVPVKAV